MQATLLVLGLDAAPRLGIQLRPQKKEAGVGGLEVLLGPNQGFGTLTPRERQQGVIGVYSGQGPVRMVSAATQMDQDQDQDQDAGQAQARVVAITDAARKVSAAVLQSTADFCAGKTTCVSQARRIVAIRQQVISLSATGPDGSRASLNPRQPPPGLTPEWAKLDVRPEPEGPDATGDQRAPRVLEGVLALRQWPSWQLRPPMSGRPSG